jgi:hypothetical protein
MRSRQLHFGKLCSVKFVKIAKIAKIVKKNKTRVQMPQGGEADALTLPSEMGFVGFW